MYINVYVCTVAHTGTQRVILCMYANVVCSCTYMYVNVCICVYIHKLNTQQVILRIMYEAYIYVVMDKLCV